MVSSNEYKILSQEIVEMQKKIDWLDGYVKHMTYFCSGVALVLIYGLLKLHGIIDF